MAMLLEKELELYGCDMGADDFHDLLVTLYHALFPSLTVEDILCRPEECATPFVRAVKSRPECRELPEEMVCRRLLNMRKASALEV